MNLTHGGHRCHHWSLGSAPPLHTGWFPETGSSFGFGPQSINRSDEVCLWEFGQERSGHFDLVEPV